MQVSNLDWALVFSLFSIVIGSGSILYQKSRK